MKWLTFSSTNAVFSILYVSAPVFRTITETDTHCHRVLGNSNTGNHRFHLHSVHMLVCNVMLEAMQWSQIAAVSKKKENGYEYSHFEYPAQMNTIHVNCKNVGVMNNDLKQNILKVTLNFTALTTYKKKIRGL